MMVSDTYVVYFHDFSNLLSFQIVSLSKEAYMFLLSYCLSYLNFF